MARGRKIGLAAIVALLIVLFAAWYLASPALALSGLRDAAREGNKDELAERVDFPALRESLKSQFKAVLATKLADSREEGGFAMLGAAMAMSLVDPMVEGFVTPDALNRMITKAQESAGDAAATDEGTGANWTVTRSGLSKFTARPEGDAANATGLVFLRDGLGWKLTDIEIPQSILEAEQPSVP